MHFSRIEGQLPVEDTHLHISVAAFKEMEDETYDDMTEWLKSEQTANDFQTQSTTSAVTDLDSRRKLSRAIGGDSPSAMLWILMVS